MGARLDLAEPASPSRADDLPYAVSTLDRAIDVLEAFSHKSPELSLKQIAARTGLHKATAFRLVTTLSRRGLVIKHPITGRYRLGPRDPAWDRAVRRVGYQLGVMERVRSRSFLVPPHDPRIGPGNRTTVS